ncbi:hypothetical protein EMN47_01660 [Prolixibacteraceae bacterium JC049]|nr:hypothetical protein [Prolixibacteraceae bacterium JC049]
MNKFILILILIPITHKISTAQSKGKPIKKFKAKLVNEFGNPVSDAYIINYRNYHGVTSKSDGSFGIYTQENDSMVISHISYERKIIHAKDTDSTIVLNIEPFELSPIVIQNRDIEMVYFEKNMKRMRKQLKKMFNGSWDDGSSDSYRSYRNTIQQFQHPNHK